MQLDSQRGTRHISHSQQGSLSKYNQQKVNHGFKYLLLIPQEKLKSDGSEREGKE